jgi:NADH-quinone oxidoreductase subunit M
MIALLLILIPVIGGIAALFFKNEKAIKPFSIAVSIITLIIALAGVYSSQPGQLHYDIAWLPDLNSRFTLGLDGLSKILGLLNAAALPVIITSTYKNYYPDAGKFYGLMFLCQAGMMGVFLSMDALLFYFFWELALIPAYFLCSIWGGEKRIQVTLKFFIYTFVGSLLMLVAILCVYFKTPDHSFALQSFYHAKLSASSQQWMFWLFFIALAIKMPVFPFHTCCYNVIKRGNGEDGRVRSDTLAYTGISASFTNIQFLHHHSFSDWNVIRFFDCNKTG